MNESDAGVRLAARPHDRADPAFRSRWTSTLFSDFSWTLVGNGVFAACQWGVVIVLAKMLTSFAVGEYSLSQAILAPTLMLAAFQLRGVVASDLQHQFTTREYFGFRLTTLAVGLFLAMIIAILTTRSAVQIEMVGIVGLIQAAELTSDTLYGFRQRRGDLVRPAASMIMKGPVGLAALTTGVFLVHSAITGLCALLATRVLLLVTYDLSGAIDSLKELPAAGSRYFTCKGHAQLFRVVFFVGMMTMLAALITMMPRYFVNYLKGPSELGVYGAISSLVSIGLMPVGALGMAAFVPLARAFSEGKPRDFIKILSVLLGLSIIIGVGGVTAAYFAGRQILTLLFRPEYAAYTQLFKLTMVIGAITFITASLGASLTAARIFKPQAIVLAVVMLAEAFGCWALVPRIGLTGAALGSLIGSIVQFVGTAVLLVRFFPHARAIAATSTHV